MENRKSNVLVSLAIEKKARIDHISVSISAIRNEVTKCVDRPKNLCYSVTAEPVFASIAGIYLCAFIPFPAQTYTAAHYKKDFLLCTKLEVSSYPPLAPGGY